MTEKQKKVLKLSIAFAVSFAIYPAANAMHIISLWDTVSRGALSACLFW